MERVQVFRSALTPRFRSVGRPRVRRFRPSLSPVGAASTAPEGWQNVQKFWQNVQDFSLGPPHRAG